ncbi:MAG: sensor histidine kinase [Bdellovibrionota bacterium]
MIPPKRKESTELDSALALAAEAVDELLGRQKAESAANQLETQIDLREKFISLLSHDLRTPLTAAVNCAEIIRRHPERGEENRSLAEKILASIRRADLLIEELLNVNRLRAGMKLPVKPAPVDLKPLLEETIEILASVHGGRCELRLTGADIPPAILDRAAIQRALENLITNAVKYGSAQTPIHVLVQGFEDRLEISVHNSGPAMSEEDRAKLFQWHGRTRSAQESGKPGFGLGLMLVKGVVESHGGSMRVQSTAEQGTTFTMVLPKLKA